MDPNLLALARAHRRRLEALLGDGLILLHAAPESIRNGDVTFSYRQDSSFLWLSGVLEPGYALLLDPITSEEILFVPKLTQKHAVWLGHIPSLTEAKRRFGFRRVAHLDQLSEELRRHGRGRRRIHTDRRSLALARRVLPRLHSSQEELEEALAELRIVKDEGEIALIARASAATEAGFLSAMRLTRPGLFEYQVQAELERGFRHQGCAQTGFASILASGPGSAVLHYQANDRRLGKNELLLIDAGAEYRGYSADVTRTIPVSGRFTPRQRALYDVVLAAQNRVIDHARNGVTSLELQRRAEETLAAGLRDLSLLRGDPIDLVDSAAVRVFFPHGIGHPLGLDVHDVTGGKRRRLRAPRNSKLRFRTRLEPGFVITVEPGIYFIEALLHDPELRRRHREQVAFAEAERWLGSGGIRIEDDVVVQANGPARNLTKLPKTASAIETACRF